MSAPDMTDELARRGFRLEVHCGCGHATTMWPGDLSLIRPPRDVRDLAAKLHCSRCGHTGRATIGIADPLYRPDPKETVRMPAAHELGYWGGGRKGEGNRIIGLQMRTVAARQRAFDAARRPHLRRL